MCAVLPEHCVCFHEPSVAPREGYTGLCVAERSVGLVNALCREGSWDPEQAEPCPCPGLCPQASSLCQLRSSDVPWPGWGWLGALPRAGARAVIQPPRALTAGRGHSLLCPDLAGLWGCACSRVLGATAWLASAPPKICVSFSASSALWMGLRSQRAETNDRPTPFIMFILTFCPEMGTVLREENCWALAENGLKLLNLKYVRWPLIQPRGARTAFATRPSGGFVTSALRNIHSPALLLLLFQAALPRVHFVFVLVLLDVESRGKAGVSGWLWVPTGCGCRCGAVPHLAQFHGGGIVQQLGVEMLGFYTCACGLTQFQ